MSLRSVPGFLADDGGRVQCHECGRWFAHLGNHVVIRHRMTGDDYRDKHGLTASHGLISQALADKRREHIELRGEEWKHRWIEKAKQNGGKHPRTRGLSLETRQSKDWQEAVKRTGEKAGATQRRLYKAGLLKGRPLSKEQSLRMRELARPALKAFYADPARHQAWREALSASKGRAEDYCKVCGVRIEYEMGYGVRKKVCGPACLKENRRRIMLAAPLSKRADVREKLSKAAKARDLVHDERGRIVTWKKSG